jgi:hypothetical protein
VTGKAAHEVGVAIDAAMQATCVRVDRVIVA